MSAADTSTTVAQQPSSAVVERTDDSIANAVLLAKLDNAKTIANILSALQYKKESGQVCNILIYFLIFV